MGTKHKPVDSVRVACEICLKEVPSSAAGVPEAEEYYAHFCGLECYEEWKRRSLDEVDAPGKPSA